VAIQELKVATPTQKFGIMWDEWSPRVESAIARDLLDMKDQFPGLTISTTCKDAQRLESLCRAMQLEVVPVSPKVTVWKVYFEKDDISNKVPDYAVDVYRRFVGQRVKELRLMPNQEGYPSLYETRNNRPAPIGLSPLTKPMPPRNGRYLLPPWAYL
jgi:hypothetical protein